MTEPPDASSHERWLGHAQEGLEHAESTFEVGRPDLPVGVRRCASGCREAFKAALIKGDIELPRIHDLERAIANLLPADSAVRDVDADLASLTEWSIARGYPADTRDANRADATQAVRDARVVVDAVAAAFAPSTEEQPAES